MSPVLRRSDSLVLAPAAPGAAEGWRRQVVARARHWPGDPTAAQVVVLDPTAVPTAAQLVDWGAQLWRQGVPVMRTGALAGRQAHQAELAGMTCIQELALLEARAPFVLPPTGGERLGRVRPLVRRFGRDDFIEAAEVDRAAFGDTWGLDAHLLADVCTATPIHRARGVRVDDGGGERLAGYLVSGRSGDVGYVQRLAVHPEARRRGIATALLQDSLRWMARRRTTRAFVNTDVANDPALALYRTHGFVDLPERLRVFELTTTDAANGSP